MKPSPPRGIGHALPRALPQTARGFFLDPGRRGLSALLLGAALLAAAWATREPRDFAGAYLGAWLCLVALPAGALPVAIAIERADAWRPQPETALLGTLRWLLALMPVAALLAVPVFLLAPNPGLPGPNPPGPNPLARAWVSAAEAGRVIGCFAVWIVLTRWFARRGGAADASRRVGLGAGDARAGLGLLLHLGAGTLVVGTLVAPGAADLTTLLAGLVVMAAWSSFALAAAILFAPPDIGPARRRLDRLTPLAVLLVIWAALHLVHRFGLPAIDPARAQAWSAVRAGPAAEALAFYAGFVVLLAVLLALRPGENRTRLVAALALALHGPEMFWFATPPLRGFFAVDLADVAVLAGLLLLAVGLLPLARRLLRRGATD